MSPFELVINFFARSNFFTLVIMLWLSIYFIITFGIL
ncbi:MAG: MotA/TolQ/ExbB proton channel family protein, partial [Clostridia bacterium]|nr:MotA/TolQ/ExbB proton channel family protein [Clostridia bacterium]